jgi:hypothetical protein
MSKDVIVVTSWPTGGLSAMFMNWEYVALSRVRTLSGLYLVEPNDIEKLFQLGSPVGKFPAIYFFSPTTHKIEQQKNQKKGTNHGLTTAPFPPNPISMHCSCLPPSSRNSIHFCKEINNSGYVTV